MTACSLWRPAAPATPGGPAPHELPPEGYAASFRAKIQVMPVKDLKTAPYGDVVAVPLTARHLTVTKVSPAGSVYARPLTPDGLPDRGAAEERLERERGYRASDLATHAAVNVPYEDVLAQGARLGHAIAPAHAAAARDALKGRIAGYEKDRDDHARAGRHADAGQAATRAANLKMQLRDVEAGAARHAPAALSRDAGYWNARVYFDGRPARRLDVLGALRQAGVPEAACQSFLDTARPAR